MNEDNDVFDLTPALPAPQHQFSTQLTPTQHYNRLLPVLKPRTSGLITYLSDYNPVRYEKIEQAIQNGFQPSALSVTQQLELFSKLLQNMQNDLLQLLLRNGLLAGRPWLHYDYSNGISLEDNSQSLILYDTLLLNNVVAIKIIHQHLLKTNSLQLACLLAQRMAPLAWTPLHFATRYAKPKVVQALLEAGADMFSSDVYGRIPIELALFNHKYDNIEPYFKFCDKQENAASKQILMNKIRYIRRFHLN